MAQCKSRTENGQRCRAKVLKNSAFCFMHDPANGKARAEARKRGGERRRVLHAGNSENIPTQVRTVADTLLILDYTLAETIPMENSIARGRLLIALSEAYIRALEVGELEKRIEEIENALKLNSTGNANS